MTDSQTIPDVHSIARDQLRAFVQRVERIEEEIKTLNDDKSDIYKEEAAVGFDKKTLKKVVARRKVDDSQRQEEDALFEIYWDAVHGTNLVHARVRENIEEFDAETGEIIEERRSDAGLNIVTKHTEITASPETATECAAPEKDAAADERSVEADGGAALVRTLPSKTAEQAGGKHEVATDNDIPAVVPTSVTGEGAASALPAKSKLRPHCQRPGNTCGGYGDKHCHDCLRAMREYEAA